MAADDAKAAERGGQALEKSFFIPLGGGPNGDAFYAEFAGRRPDDLGLPGRIAWRLEQEMLAADWPVGDRLGSEAELVRGFGVARDTFREAVRILERRGAVRMVRGRAGGLIVQRPSEHQAAFTLAAYLNAIGCDPDAATRAVRAVSAEPGAALLAPLFQSLAERLTDLAAAEDAPGLGGLHANPHVRAAAISARLMADFAEVGVGARVGSEWELGMRYCGSHKVTRQALRVLSDFDVLETRRGRRGGVFFRHPTPAGIVRQLLPYLATHFDGTHLRGQIWLLTLVHLRLACERLDEAGPGVRRRMVAALADRIAPLREPWRWVVVQQVIGEIACSPPVYTLIRCLIAHALRNRGGLDPLPAYAHVPLLKDERDILGALAGGDLWNAEAALGVGQGRRESLIGEALTQHPDGPASC